MTLPFMAAQWAGLASEVYHLIVVTTPDCFHVYLSDMFGGPKGFCLRDPLRSVRVCGVIDFFYAFRNVGRGFALLRGLD